MLPETQQQDTGVSGISDRSRAIVAALLGTSATAAIDQIGGAPSIEADMGSDPTSTRCRLAGVMAEMGPACCASDAQVSSLLSSMSAPDERTVAEVLALWARAPKGIDEPMGLAQVLAAALDPATAAAAPPAPSSSWNWRMILDKLLEAAPALQWRRVAEHLDQEGFRVAGAAGFDLLATAYEGGAGEPLPLPALAERKWSNAEGQLSLLATAATAAPGTYDWERAGGRRVAALEGPEGAGGAWGSIDLADGLCRLAETGHYSSVRQLLEAPLKDCPDVLLLAVAAARASEPPPLWGHLERQLLASLTGTHLAASSPRGSGTVVLQRLLAVHPSALVQAMMDWAGAAPGRMGRVAEVCHDLHATAQVRAGTPPVL